MKIAPFRKLVSLSDATRIVMENAATLERTEDVRLGLLAGRVLALDVVSPMDVPPFDRSRWTVTPRGPRTLPGPASSTLWC